MNATDLSDSKVLAGVQERFAASTDLTIGIEEEMQILDPETLELANRFEEFVAAAPDSLSWHLESELVASEIEFKTRPHAGFAAAAAELARGRLAVGDLAAQLGAVVAITGVHPFSPWADQRILDTPRYRRLVGELGYVAWINNTWALHLHCGVRDADRAVKVAARVRDILPELLALSANSPLLGGRDTALASARTQLFIRNLPRCGISDPFTGWHDYAAYVAFLERAESIQESTELWWSVRPHHRFGTVEVRICDGQTDLRNSLALCALMLGLIAEFCAQVDEGRPHPVYPRGLIEENLWRAERHGIEGSLIDLRTGRSRPARKAIGELLESADARAAGLGLSPWLTRVATILEEGNGAMRQRRLLAEHDGDLRAVHADAVALTRASAVAVLQELAVDGPA